MTVETFTLPETVAGEKLFAVVRQMLPDVAERQIREAFERRDVKMDGTRVPRDAKPVPGATVCVYLPEQCPRQSPRVLYEDRNLMVIDKPVGVSCDADGKGGLTVGEWIYKIHSDRLSAPPMPCHRLDNPTDGLLLLAKNEEARSAMETAFFEHRVEKRYLCLVRGTPELAEATLNAYLLKDAQKARVQILNRPVEGAVPIRTEYRTVKAGETARLEIILHTGRTHQIRAQMAHIGHPLLGDDKYGDREFNRLHHAKRLMLTATELRFALEGKWSYLNDLHLTIAPKF